MSGHDASTAAREFQDQAFSRNHGLLTIDEQDVLSRAIVAIPGMGGVGGQHLISLVRTGFSHFRLADPDSFELVNINRQFGATALSRGRSKLEVMSEQARSINPHVRIDSYPEGVTVENLDTFLRGADVVMDSLDFFAFHIRRKLFMRARELGIPVVTAGPLGFSTALLVFTPGGMSFDEYFDIREGMSDEECYLRFAMGLSPRGLHFRYIDRSRVSLKRRKGPSSYIACQACACVAGMEAVRLVLGRPGVRPVPAYLQFDAYLAKFCAGRLLWGNRNPLQRLKLAIARKFLLARGERDGHQPPEKPKGEMTLPLSDSAFRYIAAAAAAAPSGDNAQPWAFSHLGDGLGVHMVEAADTSFFNFRQLATLISCGAAAENAALAASSLGFNTAVKVQEQIGTDGLVASVNLADNSREDPLAETIWERCTNRRLYTRRVVSDDIMDRLRDEVQGLGCRLHAVRGEGLKPLAKLIFQADRIRTEHRGLHEHFSSMVRFTAEEAKEKLDGLPLKNLYGGAPGEAFLTLTRDWERMRVANALGFGRIVAMHSAKGIANSGAACLLTAPGHSWRNFVVGGRALQRCWLKLTALGLAMQPMTAVTLFRLRWDLEGSDGFELKHRTMLRDLWPRFDALFPEADFSSEGQVMLFRIGYGRPIEYGTFRKPVESFLNR
jgi:molybdopterin/thiamine biosynthesis adenylyltransferase/nitroreductase